MSKELVEKFGNELMEIVNPYVGDLADEQTIIACGIHFFTTFVLLRTETVKEGVDFIFEGVKRSTEMHKKNIKQKGVYENRN